MWPRRPDTLSAVYDFALELRRKNDGKFKVKISPRKDLILSWLMTMNNTGKYNVVKR